MIPQYKHDVEDISQGRPENPLLTVESYLIVLHPYLPELKK